jgi:hypothetical protein
MTQLQTIPSVQGATRFTYRIANQRAATASHTRILALSTGLKALEPGLLLLKSKSANRQHLALGIVVGMSHHAFPIQNMRPPYPLNIPSHLYPTLTGRRRTIVKCLNHKDPFRPGNTFHASITTLLRA